MLATATGNCDVTNVTYSDNKYYVVTWTVYLESSMYLRWRQWLRQIVVMRHIACWFSSGSVLKFDQFYNSSFFKASLELFPRKCTYAKVIDLRNMVLWRIGLQVVASPPTKSACVRYSPQKGQYHICASRSGHSCHLLLLSSNELMSSCAAGSNGCSDLRCCASPPLEQGRAEWNRCPDSMAWRASQSVVLLWRSAAW